MLKQILIFIGLLLFSVMVGLQAHQLFISFYVLFPMLLLPLFYFVESRSKIFIAATGSVMLVLYGLGLSYQPSLEVSVFGVLILGICGALVLYRAQWMKMFNVEKVQAGAIHEDLKALKAKQVLRLDSLHHLEKQVSSLMDLFEIARDFSECLSFGSMADLLYKKVVPELPVGKIRLSLLKKDESGHLIPEWIFTISRDGVFSQQEKITEDEENVLKPHQGRYEMIKKDNLWIFPLAVGEEVSAIFSVEGADPSDLAKFEVLVAHLILLVKKIRLYETVKELSIRDGLTGVFVRRHFLERFEDELKRSLRHGLPMALLMLDIDHFKRYNDGFGHLVGDATLREVASLLRKNLRNVDIVARYGGEEFVVVIPETKRETAYEVAERIRSSVARHQFKLFDSRSQVTVSIGIALFPDDIKSELQTRSVKDLASELINRADRALYRAKEDGRNRVVLFGNL
ncbi:MAG: GGDEF domain-containing protein [Candidatus Omnitrophica bacterium]|nr:GGDEF domain-containing protein [Candidatus Omnitrophota bacterium]